MRSSFNLKRYNPLSVYLLNYSLQVVPSIYSRNIILVRNLSNYKIQSHPMKNLIERPYTSLNFIHALKQIFNFASWAKFNGTVNTKKGVYNQISSALVRLSTQTIETPRKRNRTVRATNTQKAEKDDME